MLSRLLLFLTALCLGSMLAKLHIPIPFILGGLITAVCCKAFVPKNPVTWPKNWREYGMVVAGYGIGATFTASTWNKFLSELTGVAESTVAIIGTSVLLAALASKLSSENLKTCIIGMMPGGMTLSMLLAEEDAEVNPNAVMVMQIIRLLGVVITVPFLVVWLLDAHVVGSGLAMPNRGGLHWLIFVPLSIVGSYVALKIHMPTPRLLGPILATAAFSVLAGSVQPVPVWIMAPAQLSIGLFMGMQLDAEKIIRARRLVPLVVFGTATMIVVSILMGDLLSRRYGFSLITAFLAMAPGGIAEMSLAGMSMNEDVSVILTYQLVRLMAVNICVPLALNWWFGKK